MKSENQMLRDHADPGVQQEIDLQDQLDLRMVSQSIIFIYAHLKLLTKRTAPRHPDDDPDLEPHEQDASYGRTTATISSLRQVLHS